MSVMDDIKIDIENAWVDVKHNLPPSREKDLLLKSLDEAVVLLERINQRLSLTKPEPTR